MKLKRLVSAVLAIGMTLTILPTAAFAAGNTIGSSEVGGLEITEAGYPKVPESIGTIDVDGITIERNYCIMQIWAESGKSALPICNYSQILYQFLTFTQNLKRSLPHVEKRRKL